MLAVKAVAIETLANIVICIIVNKMDRGKRKKITYTIRESLATLHCAACLSTKYWEHTGTSSPTRAVAPTVCQCHSGPGTARAPESNPRQAGSHSATFLQWKKTSGKRGSVLILIAQSLLPLFPQLHKNRKNTCSH